MANSNKVIGNYEILGKLGQGGMGAVFKARQLSMDRVVALKILPPKLARDEAFVHRFMREARSAGALAHPNLIQVYDVGQEAEYYYFSMELVDGPTLKQVAKQQGALPERVGLAFMKQVAVALHVAHSKGIVHRDVKPDNILIADGSIAKLGDLGLAKPMDGAADVTLTNQTIGTPAYMSPEQVRGEDCDGRSDLYSLGATFYHLLAGKPVFEGATPSAIYLKHATEPPIPIRQVRGDLSPAVEVLIDRLLAKKAEDRFANAQELIAAIDGVMAGKVPAGGKPARRARRTGGHRAYESDAVERPAGVPLPMLIGGGAAVLAVLVLVGLLLTGGDPPPRPDNELLVQQRSEPVRPPPVVPEEAELTEPTTPEPSQADQAQEMLDAALAFGKEHPDRTDRLLDYLRRVREAGKGTVVELKADQHIQRVESALAARHQAALQALLAQVDEQVADKNYAAALAVLDSGLETMDNSEQVIALKDRRQAVTNVARATMTTRLEGAKAAIAAGDLDAAVAHLAASRAVALPSLVQSTAAAHDALQQQIARARQQAAAAERDRMAGLMAEHLDAVVQYLGGGDLAKARDHVDDIRAKRSLKPVRSGVDALIALVAAAEVREASIRDAIADRVGQTIEMEVQGKPQQLVIKRVTDKGIDVDITLGGTTAEVRRRFTDITPRQRQELLQAWKPTSIDDQALVCVYALIKGHADDAAVALDQIGDHPLQQLLSEDVAELREGAAELAARKSWEQLMATFAQPDLEASEAEAGVGAIDDWLRKHQATLFKKGLGPLPDTLRTRLAFMTGGPLNDGLIVHWAFDALAGGMIRDQTGNGHDLAPGPTAIDPNGHIGGCLRIGTDGGITDGPTSAALEDSDQLTLALWFKVDENVRNGGAIFGKRAHWRTENNMAYYVHYSRAKRTEGGGWQLAVDLATLNSRTRCKTALSFGRWMHVVVAFDGSQAASRRAQIYVNGKHDTSMTVPVSRIPITGHPIMFGMSPVSELSRSMRIDDVRIYRRALTAAEAQALYKWRP